MVDLVVDVTVKTAAGTTILDLVSTAGYDVVSVGEGDRVWRRLTAQSDWVEGRIKSAAVLDVMSATVVVRCRSTTQAGLRTLVANARAAFETTATTAPDFVLWVNIGGQTEKWACECADSTLGDSAESYDQFEFIAFRQTLTFTIPRAPTVLA